MEQTHAGSMSSTIIDGATVLEIQAKSQVTCQGFKLELSTLVQELASTYFFGIVDIPCGLHKFIIGKGGANLAKIKVMGEWDGSLIDVVIPNESEKSDDVLIVVKTGCEDLVAKVGDEMIKNASTSADYIVQNVAIDARFIGKLIGTGGERLKEIIGREFAGHVDVKTPRRGKDLSPDTVSVRGPSKGVKEVAGKIEGLVKEWKHAEVMNSFEERVKVPKGLGKKLVGAWLFKALKEAVGDGSGKAEVDESDDVFDVVVVTGCKEVVEAARGVILERAKKVEEIAEARFDIFAEVGDAAKLEIAEAEEPESLKGKVVRRVIGKDWKGIRKLTTRHEVEVHFQKPEDGGEEGMVSIKGAKAGVDACRKELTDLVEHEV
jgi:hypothetical protein